MLRVFIMGIILFMNLILQSTFMQSISINGISPNLFVITTVSFALLRGKYAGAAVGFFTGLLQDIFFGKVLAFYALIYFLLGFFIGYLNRSFYRDSVLIPTAVVAGCDLVFGIVIYTFTYLFRGKLEFLFYFFNIILPEVAYTTLLAVVIYKLYHYMNYKLEIRERKGSVKN